MAGLQTVFAVAAAADMPPQNVATMDCKMRGPLAVLLEANNLKAMNC